MTSNLQKVSAAQEPGIRPGDEKYFAVARLCDDLKSLSGATKDDLWPVHFR